MTQSKKQIKSLNIIRGLAILAILAYHFYVALYSTPIFNNLNQLKTGFMNNFPQSMFSAWFLSNYQGVHLFLFLSGFLLSLTFLNKNLKLKHFYFKRLKRIWLPFFPALLFSLLITVFVFNNKINSITILASVFFPLDIFSKYLSLINPSFWFLGLIIQFYLFFPILLKLLKKLKAVKFLVLISVLTIIFRFLAVFVFSSHPIGALLASPNGATGFIILPTRLFELALGMSMAYFYQKKAFKLPFFAIFIGLTIWLWGNIFTLFKIGWLFSDQLLMIGLFLIFWPLSIYLNKIKPNQAIFGFLAKYSYFIYLYHYPLIFGLAYFFFKSLAFIN